MTCIIMFHLKMILLDIYNYIYIPHFWQNPGMSSSWAPKAQESLDEHDVCCFWVGFVMMKEKTLLLQQPFFFKHSSQYIQKKAGQPQNGYLNESWIGQLLRQLPSPHTPQCRATSPECLHLAFVQQDILSWPSLWVKASTHYLRWTVSCQGCRTLVSLSPKASKALQISQQICYYLSPKSLPVLFLSIFPSNSFPWMGTHPTIPTPSQRGIYQFLPEGIVAASHPHYHRPRALWDPGTSRGQNAGFRMEKIPGKKGMRTGKLGPKFSDTSNVQSLQSPKKQPKASGSLWVPGQKWIHFPGEHNLSVAIRILPDGLGWTKTWRKEDCGSRTSIIAVYQTKKSPENPKSLIFLHLFKHHKNI